MKKVLRIFGSSLLGALGCCGIAFIGLLLSEMHPKIWFKALMILPFLGLGVYVGISIFKASIETGFFGFITNLMATPELDDLSLINESEDVMDYPKESFLQVPIKKLKGRNIYEVRINKEVFNSSFEISSLEFNEDTQSFDLSSKKGKELKVESPEKVRIGKHFLIFYNCRALKLYNSNQAIKEFSPSDKMSYTVKLLERSN